MPTRHGVGFYEQDVVNRHLEDAFDGHPDEIKDHLMEVHGLSEQELKMATGYEFARQQLTSVHRLDHRWAYGEVVVRETEAVST